MNKCHRKSCTNPVAVKGRKYCAEHSCRIAGCMTAHDLCRLHYCWLRDGRRCGQPVKKEGQLCLKLHACSSCGPNVSRADCRQHYCWLRNGRRCGQPIKKEGQLCSRHACHRCGPLVSRDDCAQHYCHDDHCNLPVIGARYCEQHACALCDRSRNECGEHRCPIVGCVNSRRALDAGFCEQHTCPVPDCPCANVPCHVHRCQRRCCDKIRHGEGWPFCTWHSALPAIASSQLPPHQELIGVLRQIYDCPEEEEEENRLHHSLPRDTAPVEKIILLLRQHLLYRRLLPIARELNKAITPKDTRARYLVCENYCSSDYCSCDVMPRIDLDYLWLNRDAETWLHSKPVGLLSHIVRANEHEIEYYAWTLPLHILQELEVAHPVEDMIRFERIRR